MANYGWFPVTSSNGTYTWHPTGLWTNAAYWANFALQASDGNIPGPSDNAYIASVNVPSFLVPPQYSRPPYNVDITLNSGVQTVATLNLGRFSFLVASPSPPEIDVLGATLHVTGATADHFTATFPSPVGTQTFTGGGLVEIGSSGIVDFGGTVDSGITALFQDGSADRLILDAVSGANPTAVLATISQFQMGNGIDLTQVSPAGATPLYDTVTQTLTITTGAVVDAVLHVPGSFTTASFALLSDGSGGTLIVSCFAEGSRIRTPAGDVAVETLCAGDLVTTQEGSAEAVRWVGRRHIDLSRHPARALVDPVRVRRSAFGAGIPSRDLLLSPDHAVFVDGALIPVRLLVNGSSIAVETGGRSVTYYHVELARHAVLLAEALPVESYIDTGNRDVFEGSDTPIRLHPEFDGTATEAQRCAPLVVDAEQVRPVWERLAARSARRGASITLPGTAGDPDLRLVLPNGRVLRPTSAGSDGIHRFALPPGAESARLVSHAAAPSESQPWLDDRRRLGVLIARIEQRSATGRHAVAVDAPDLDRGWWAPERTAAGLHRWTDGDADIPLRPDATVLEVRLAPAEHRYVSARVEQGLSQAG